MLLPVMMFVLSRLKLQELIKLLHDQMHSHVNIICNMTGITHQVMFDVYICNLMFVFILE